VNSLPIIYDSGKPQCLMLPWVSRVLTIGIRRTWKVQSPPSCLWLHCLS
jgi:hypothetical protein